MYRITYSPLRCVFRVEMAKWLLEDARVCRIHRDSVWSLRISSRWLVKVLHYTSCGILHYVTGRNRDSIQAVNTATDLIISASNLLEINIKLCQYLLSSCASFAVICNCIFCVHMCDFSICIHLPITYCFTFLYDVASSCSFQLNMTNTITPLNP